MKILGPWRRPRHRTVLPGSNLSEAAIGVAIRSCPGVQPRRSYSRLHAIIADSASFANSADRFANNFASDTLCSTTQRIPLVAEWEILCLRRGVSRGYCGVHLRGDVPASVLGCAGANV